MLGLITRTSALPSPAFQLITPPAQEPISLADAKSHLRVEHTIDDTYITGLIVAARAYAENVAWRGFVTQTWELVLRCFPGFPNFGSGELEEQGGVELPRGNVNSITSVKYYDMSGVQQTLASSEYVLDDVNVPGRVIPAYGKVWPSTRDRFDAVRIRYVVGWAVGSVPQPIIQSILLVLSQLYEQRAVTVVGSLTSEMQFAVDALLAPYRLVRY